MGERLIDPSHSGGGRTEVFRRTQPKSAITTSLIDADSSLSNVISKLSRHVCVRSVFKLWRSCRKSAHALRRCAGRRNKIAGLGMVSTGICAVLPGIVALCQICETRRRIGEPPSSARAGSGPSVTIRCGAASTIIRCKNGRHAAISPGLGGRSPGGRHGINGARQIVPRCTSMLRSISSRYAPTGPANGLPVRSASAFGASPTNSSLHAGSPSRNTRFVAVSRNALPSKLAIAARNASSVGAAAASEAARSAAAPRPAIGAGVVAGDVDRAVGVDRAGGRIRSTGSVSSASSAPHSICSRRAVSASIIVARCPRTRSGATSTPEAAQLAAIPRFLPTISVFQSASIHRAPHMRRATVRPTQAMLARNDTRRAAWQRICHRARRWRLTW